MSASQLQASEGGLTPCRVRGAGPLHSRMVARAVEAAVVPRLLLGRAPAPPPAPGARAWAATEEQVADFARLALGRQPGALTAAVFSLRVQGASLESIYLDLIAPAARLLGRRWEDDDLDFLQVTEGLGRIQHALRELGPDFVDEGPAVCAGARILMVPLPGEQHTLGLNMVCDFFRRAGWDVWSDPALPSSELASLVHAESFAVVAFSVLCDALLGELADAIRLVRGASRNRSVRVMVGGPAFAARPGLAAEVGADATAADGRAAVVEAGRLLAALQGRD